MFSVVEGGSSSVTLSLQTNEDHLKLFPHPFELTVTVKLLQRRFHLLGILCNCASMLSLCMFIMYGRMTRSHYDKQSTLP